MKNDLRRNIFLNLSSGQQYLLNDFKKFRQNGKLKVEICLKKKKTHPEHKYSVTFVSKVGTIKNFGDGGDNSRVIVNFLCCSF